MSNGELTVNNIRSSFKCSAFTFGFEPPNNMASSMSTSDTVIRVLTKDQLLAYLDLPANCSFTQTFDIRGYGVT